jgi:hypothetical protein
MQVLNTMIANVNSINGFADFPVQANDKALFFFKSCVVTTTIKIVEINFHSGVLMISVTFEMKKSA